MFFGLFQFILKKNENTNVKYAQYYESVLIRYYFWEGYVRALRSTKSIMAHNIEYV